MSRTDARRRKPELNGSSIPATSTVWTADCQLMVQSTSYRLRAAWRLSLLRRDDEFDIDLPHDLELNSLEPPPLMAAIGVKL